MSTGLMNHVGVPAFSLLCGFSREGLPIRVQIIAPHWCDERALAAGIAFQEISVFHEVRPSVASL